MPKKILEVSDEKSFLVGNREKIAAALEGLNKARELGMRAGIGEELAQGFVAKYPDQSVEELAKMVKRGGKNAKKN